MHGIGQSNEPSQLNNISNIGEPQYPDRECSVRNWLSRARIAANSWKSQHFGRKKKVGKGESLVGDGRQELLFSFPEGLQGRPIRDMQNAVGSRLRLRHDLAICS